MILDTVIISRRHAIVGMVSVVLIAGQTAAWAQKAQTPLTVARFFYSETSDITKPPYSKRLKALHAAAMKKSTELSGPVKGTEFEPYLGGQTDDGPGEPRGLKFTAKSTEADKAMVEVTFRNGGAVVLNYELVLEDGAWKVDDIVNTSKTKGWRWSSLLAAGAKGEQS